MLHSVVGIHCAPGTLGKYQPLMLGLVSWVLLTWVSIRQHEQRWTNSRVEPLLSSFKHLFQQYIIIGTAFKNTSDIFDIKLRYNTFETPLETPLK